MRRPTARSLVHHRVEACNALRDGVRAIVVRAREDGDEVVAVVHGEALEGEVDDRLRVVGDQRGPLPVPERWFEAVAVAGRPRFERFDAVVDQRLAVLGRRGWDRPPSRVYRDVREDAGGVELAEVRDGLATPVAGRWRALSRPHLHA